MAKPGGMDSFWGRSSGIEKKLMGMAPGTYEADLKEPKLLRFTDIDKFLGGGMHGLIVGITGAGKTTLLLSLLDALIDRGYTILARDDGGLESLHLLHKVPMRIWIPEGCRLKMDTPHKHEVREFDWQNPLEILEGVYDYPFNLVVFDAFCIDPGLSALFYSNLFKLLIYRCMQTPMRKKKKLIFSIDELNDLVQPKGYELSGQHTSVRSLIEYNIRKLRKHQVTLLASTHRFTQLGISVRSQFSYIFMKQSYGWDAWDFISKSLATQNNKVFWATLKDISSFEKKYFYLFDYKNNFDKYEFGDIRREEIEYEMSGVVEEEKKVTSRSPKFLQRVRMAYYMGMGKSPQEVSELLDMPMENARREKYRIQKEYGLDDIEWRHEYDHGR